MINKQFYDAFAFKPVLTEKYFEGEALEIGFEPQLVMGDIVVEDSYRVTHFQNTPKLYGNKPILTPEYPWESRYISVDAIIYDDDEKIYKAWYEGRILQDRSNPDNDWEKNLPIGNAPGVICYAESKDLFNWTKPMFNYCKIGTLETSNIVFTGGETGLEGARVFQNPSKYYTEYKYLMIYLELSGPRVAGSPDGRKWEDIPGINPILPCTYDTYYHVIYNKEKEKFLLYIRPSIFAKDERIKAEPVCINLNYRRRITVSESSDLVHWSTPRIVQHSRETDKYEHCDNENTFIVGSHVLARMDKFRVRVLDDAIHQRHFPYWTFGPDPYHMSFLDEDEQIPDYVGREGEEDPRSKIIGYPLYVDGKTLFTFTRESEKVNEKGRHLGETWFLAFDENQFVARTADEYGGWLLTREFYFRGSKLEINCDIPEGGYIEAEILYSRGGACRAGQQIEGYRIPDGSKITESGIHQLVTWNGVSDMSRFKDQKIYIRFHIVNAKLYGFKVLE